ncbi:tryptophan halogenase family protein [Shewanella waksmanii]|uniref:tryptophan halogenase family protein n=1 Tax=Shewanella waksmanii TaxID=213783 RepID=UPI0004B0D87A|nr:tryptophan halogenase family protein [Shewanella waksmanii]
MKNIPKQIVILGGGTAGWMTANLMHKRWQGLGVEITLIESTVEGTVGVGEGTTPFIQSFFDSIDVSESEWMPEANATYKCGISFPNWSTKTGYDNYFHPFYSHVDTAQVEHFFNNANFRREGMDTHAHPDDYFVTSALARQCRAPISQVSKGQRLDYGYHFDAELLGRYLKRIGTGRGVKHVDDKVVEVVGDNKGNIDRLILAGGEHVYGDFFVDCSGFKGLLIQQTLGEQLKDYSHYLFNNRAVAIQTPLSQQDSLSSETVSQALSAGWAWKIPLANRFGNGYVYSGEHITAEQAETELRAHLGDASKDAKALHLQWKVGRVSNHWKGNCVAIGLSQGFLEPLEAPMLNVIQQTLEQFVKYFETGEFTNQYQTIFNEEVNHLIDGTRDYLQAHYLLNSRVDSPYWRECRDNPVMSTSLKNIINGWISTGSFDAVLRDNLHNQAYFKTSWYCILAGMGHFNPVSKRGSRIAARNHQKAKQACEVEASRYVDHQQHIDSQKAASND